MPSEGIEASYMEHGCWPQACRQQGVTWPLACPDRVLESGTSCSGPVSDLLCKLVSVELVSCSHDGVFAVKA